VTASTYDVVDRKVRFEGAMFDVVTDDVTMPGGVVAARDFMIHVGAVGVVALDSSDRVALVHQYRHPVGAFLWELPAGLIDIAGEPLRDAAARELAEEADLVAAEWQLLLDLHTTPGASNEVIRLFLARGLSPVPDEQRHQREHEEAELTMRMVPLDEALDMVFRGEITNGPAIAGLSAAAVLRSRGWPAPGRDIDSPLPPRRT
jgi:8-oxo-dGDP phosphatase